MVSSSGTVDAATWTYGLSSAIRGSVASALKVKQFSIFYVSTKSIFLFICIYQYRISYYTCSTRDPHNVSWQQPTTNLFTLQFLANLRKTSVSNIPQDSWMVSCHGYCPVLYRWLRKPKEEMHAGPCY